MLESVQDGGRCGSIVPVEAGYNMSDLRQADGQRVKAHSSMWAGLVSAARDTPDPRGALVRCSLCCAGVSRYLRVAGYPLWPAGDDGLPCEL